MTSCRENTTWLVASISDLAKFARVNSLPNLGLALDRATEIYFQEEQDLAERKRNRRNSLEISCLEEGI